MPPEAKFSCDEIIDAAFDLVRKDGFTALTARGLAAVLGTSPRPIFTACGSIEKVRTAVLRKAGELYAKYVEEGLSHDPPFKGVGEQYMRFAAEEPVLFRLLFMTPRETPPPVGQALAAMDRNYGLVLASVMETYGLTEKEGRRLYEHLGVYTHGHAAMIATGMSSYDPDALSAQLTDLFVSILVRIKGERIQDADPA